jgi:hypothetical protein
VQHVSTVPCPECGLVLPPDQLEDHLRTTHHLYLFRGHCASLADTLAALLHALCQGQADRGAYGMLEQMGREQYGRKAGAFLASSLSSALDCIDPERRLEVAQSLAGSIAGHRSARAVGLFLAADPLPAARELALWLAPQRSLPLDRRSVRALRPLLRDPLLSSAAQFAAAAALFRTIGCEGPRARRLLRALVAGRRKRETVARLRQLADQIGPSATLDEFRRRIENRIRMRCPRCRVQMHRPEMIQHLWLEHQLVLDGNRAREPWELIDQWLEAARMGQTAEILKRCQTFAEQINPEHGLRRLQRLIVARDLPDPESRRALLAEAAERQASLCPHCCDLVPIPRDLPPRPMSVNRGRLSVDGYRVVLSESGLHPWIEFETPHGGRQRVALPGRRWTRKAALLAVVGPPVLLAVLLAFVNLGLPPLPPVALLLLSALVLYAGLQQHWRNQAPASDLAIDHAWTWLAPRLHAEGFSLADSAFLASLAQASLAHGRPEARRPALDRLLKLTERVVSAGFGGARYLAALRRLAIADAVRDGQDRVRLVVAEIRRCFQGKLPLAYAEGLLEGGPKDGWNRADLARLRILLCDLGFEAGFEVRDLREAGETAPSLGRLLGCDDAEALAHLRLLWSLRATRPWDRCGDATTAFDVAGEEGARALLDNYPDLLLRHTLPHYLAGDGPAEGPYIVLCSRGVFFRQALFTHPPHVIEVVARKGKRDYELVVDERRFRFDSSPDVVATRLERWCRYYYEEFLPLVPDVHRWRSPDATAVLRAWGVVRCPDCGRSLLPVPGEVGISLEEEKKDRN